MIAPDLNISHTAFWDVEINNLHAEKDAAFIIYRVFEFGDIEDLKSVIKYYGKENLPAYFAQVRNFTPLTKEFIKNCFGYEKDVA